MRDHRIRLTDGDIDLILATLRARRAMTTGPRQHRIDRLIERLSEGARGNPKWLLGELPQTHEEDWGDGEPDDFDEKFIGELADLASEGDRDYKDHDGRH